MYEQFLETWAINGRINAFFLNEVDTTTLWEKANKGKAVGAHLAHMHNVRLMWLKASAPALLEGLEKLEEGATKEQILAAHVQSGERMAALIGEGLEAGRVKGFKPHAAAFLAYMLAHEAHHRGQAELILRQLGQPVSDKVMYGMWEWGSR